MRETASSPGFRALGVADLAVLVAGFAILMMWAGRVMPPELLSLTAILGGCLLLLAWFDATALRLPDPLTLSLIVLGLPAGYSVSGAVLDHVLGAAMGFGVCWLTAALHRRWRGTDGLGMGDAKLCAAGGAWLGVSAVPGFILLACLGAGIWLLTLWALRGRTAFKEPLPLGIPLGAAIWTVWLYGPL